MEEMKETEEASDNGSYLERKRRRDSEGKIDRPIGNKNSNNYNLQS